MYQALLWDTSLYDFLWLFIIYSFLGWCAEVIAHAVTLKKFVNRGFLNGVYCPIYGFGVVLVVICLTPIQDNLLLLFAGSIVLTSVLELITGFILEKVFHTRWWDYSNQKLNIGGYICLKYSILWGAACVVVMKAIQPLIMDLIKIIPQIAGQIIVFIFLLGMLTDLVSVIISLSSMSKRIRLAEDVKKRILESSDKIGGKIAGDVLELQEKLDKLPDRKSIIQRRLEKAYPPLANINKDNGKEELKALLKQKLNEIKPRKKD